MKREPKNKSGEGKVSSFLPHPLPGLLLAPFFARSLTIVPRSLLLNRTETKTNDGHFYGSHTWGNTLGARDFSSAVSGFCQVFIVTRAFFQAASPLVHRKFLPYARKSSGTQGRIGGGVRENNANPFLLRMANLLFLFVMMEFEKLLYSPTAPR